jgi:hypothetical protein
VLLPGLNSGHRPLASMEDGRRLLPYVNVGLQVRLGFSGGRQVLKRRRPMVSTRVHGSWRAVQGGRRRYSSHARRRRENEAFSFFRDEGRTAGCCLGGRRGGLIEKKGRMRGLAGGFLQDVRCSIRGRGMEI